MLDSSGSGDRVEELTLRLAELERRLETVEDRLGLRDWGPEVAGESGPGAAAGGERMSLPLVGRTLVVLAGAFALRALTEQGVLPQTVGMGIGMLYAGLWILLSERSAAAGRRTGATFHGVAAAAIGYPIVWEATTRFGILSAGSATLVLAMISAVGLAIAWRRGLRRLAWVMVLGAGATGLVLTVTTRTPMPFAIFLLALGMATLWLGYVNGWRGPGWAAAVCVNVAILFLTLVLRIGRPEEIGEMFAPGALVALQVAMMVLYLASFGARTLTRSRALHPGEIGQGLAALALGLGAATITALHVGMPLTTLGLVDLLLAVCCYGIGFAVMDRGQHARLNFWFYTTLALVLTLAAAVSLLHEPLRSGVLCLVAVVAGWLGMRFARATLSLHASAYVVAAALTSGLSAGVLAAFAGDIAAVVSWVGLPTLIVIAAAAVCSWLPVQTDPSAWSVVSAAPKAIVLATLALGVDALAVALFVRMMGGADSAITPGALDALRTAVLSLTAIGLAFMGRWPRVSEAAWLVYPGLVLGAGKLLFEDLRHGEAATLFVSLAFYGAALIIAPRILGRGGQEETG